MKYDYEKMKLCVLISCMNQGHDIIERTHVQTNVVVVNQCDEEKIEEWDFKNTLGQNCHVKFISTKERGLSRSRNMGIRNAIGDICILSDDDEELVDGYESVIGNAYKAHPGADLITFAFDRKDKTFAIKSSVRHNVKSLLKTSSVEITFLRNEILNKSVFFDEKMGSGTGNGPGEETMFLMTCWRNGFKMYYDPHVIGRLLSTNSQWFNGYTERYFENFGWSARRVLGSLTSLLYIVFWLIRHCKLYCDNIDAFRAFRCSMKGWRSKR